jgi:hypothetical protein
VDVTTEHILTVPKPGLPQSPFGAADKVVWALLLGIFVTMEQKLVNVEWIFIAGNQIKISLARFHKTFEVNPTLTWMVLGQVIF